MPMLDTITMPAGTYYIGDLCYVLGSRWDEVCELVLDQNNACDGVFELSDGTRFAMFGTAYGDGEYQDCLGRSYSVDSGTLGCVLVSATGVDVNRAFNQGSVEEFSSPFQVYSNQGEIRFGDLWIDTDPDLGYEEYHYEEDEDVVGLDVFSV